MLLLLLQLWCYYVGNGGSDSDIEGGWSAIPVVYVNCRSYWNIVYVFPFLVMIVIGDCKIIVNILKNKKIKNADHL